MVVPHLLKHRVRPTAQFNCPPKIWTAEAQVRVRHSLSAVTSDVRFTDFYCSEVHDIQMASGVQMDPAKSISITVT